MPSGRLWVKCNLGAEQETDYGLYFSWGNTDGYAGDSGHDFGVPTDYDVELRTWGGVYGATPGGALTGSYAPGGAHDAARAMLGAPYKMPTRDDFEELLDTNNCTNEHVDNYNGSGVAGRLFTSVRNGETLFFPYAGYVSGSTLKNVGTSGDYTTASIVDAEDAYVLGLRSDSVQVNAYKRCSGFTARAVK